MKIDPAIVATIAASLIIAGLRLSGVKAEWFQATAHLYLGGLCVAWAYEHYLRRSTLSEWLYWQWLPLIWAEIFCFAWGYLSGPQGG